MALLMIYSKKNRENFKHEAIRCGFDWFQTDNIYLFLKYAKEAKPEVVMMDFEDDFNFDECMVNELYDKLCENNMCPRIVLNRFEDFEGKMFFESTDFEKVNVQKYLN